MCKWFKRLCVQDLAARNVVVDDDLVCKISAIDRCEQLNESEPFARVRHAFLPARRYAIAGTSYGHVSLSVCLCSSQVGVLSIETDKRIRLVFGIAAAFHPSCDSPPKSKIMWEEEGTFPCDPVWHVSSRNGEAYCELLCIGWQWRNFNASCLSPPSCG